MFGLSAELFTKMLFFVMKKASLLFHTSFIFIFVIMFGNKSINICEERTQ